MRYATFAVLCLVAAASAFPQSATFFDVGSGGFNGVSPNGLVAAGTDLFGGAFFWTEGTGKVYLGDAEGFAVTNDTIVVGRFRDPNTLTNGNPTLVAGYWKNGEWTSIGGLPGVVPFDSELFSHGYGVSDDGTTIVGMGWYPNYRTEAFYWTEATGIVPLGQDGGFNSRANDATADGAVMVGWDGILTGPDRRAYLWDPEPHFLGGFDASYPVGECSAISPNGTRVVGQSAGQPFVWTEANGMQRIIDNNLYPYGGFATNITNDGTIIGGINVTFSKSWAFIRFPGEDVKDLKEYLMNEMGVEGLEEWTMSYANGISADGQTIVGWGLGREGPFSLQDAFVVRLTPPVSDMSIAVDIDPAWLPVAAEGDTVPVNLTFTNHSSDTVTIDFQVRLISPGDLVHIVREQGPVMLGPNETEQHERMMQVIADGPPGPYRIVARWGNYLESSASFSFEKVAMREGTADLTVREAGYPTLEQNSPNPFNPSTVISFSLPGESRVKLEVFNMLGQRVAQLVDGVRGAGRHQVVFNASNLASGIYLYRLETPGSVTTKKLMVMK